MGMGRTPYNERWRQPYLGSLSDRRQLVGVLSGILHTASTHRATLDDPLTATPHHPHSPKAPKTAKIDDSLPSLSQSYSWKQRKVWGSPDTNCGQLQDFCATQRTRCAAHKMFWSQLFLKQYTKFRIFCATRMFFTVFTKACSEEDLVYPFPSYFFKIHFNIII